MPTALTHRRLLSSQAGGVLRAWYARCVFARVVAISDEYLDPSGSTEAFRAFQAAESAPQEASKLPLIIAAAAVAVAAIGLVGWLALG